MVVVQNEMLVGNLRHRKVDAPQKASPSDDAAEKNAASLFYNKKSPLDEEIKIRTLASVIFIFFLLQNAVLLTIRLLRNMIFGTKDVRPKKGRMHPHFLDFSMGEEETLAKARECAAKDEPVIVRNIPEEYFEILNSKPDFNLPDDFPGQSTSGAYLIMDCFLLPSLGKKLNGLIRSMLTHGAVMMARFQGGYKTCVAHIDSGTTFNFYYVRRGAKQVTLVPPEFSSEFELTRGSDSVYLEGSDKDYENFGHRFPAHYYFTVQEGEVLIFNNCSLLHQFTNLTGQEEIFTIRTMAFFSTATTILRNDWANWGNALHMAREAFTTRSVREIEFMG